MPLSPLFLLSCVALNAPAADKIYRKGQKQPLQVTVVSEDYAVVKYKPQDVNQTVEIKAESVDRIEYEDTPEAFRTGQTALKSGDHLNAVNSFKLALRSRTRNNWLEVYGNFYLGMAHYQWGAKDPLQYAEAAKAFDATIKAEPKSRFAAEALKRWGLALSLSKDPKGAAAVFDRLVVDARDKKLGISWEAEALILKADAFAQNNLAAEATDAYREAGNFAQANAEAQKNPSIKALLQSIRGRAQMSQGEALLRSKKHADAQRFFEQVARDPGATPESVAGALSGLGEVMLAQSKVNEAIEQFSTVKVRFHRVRSEAARATFFLGESYLLAEPADANHRRRAMEYFREVVERYSDTLWAEQARAKLKSP